MGKSTSVYKRLGWSLPYFKQQGEQLHPMVVFYVLILFFPITSVYVKVGKAIKHYKLFPWHAKKGLGFAS